MMNIRIRAAILALTGFIALAPVGGASAATVDDGVSIGGLSFYLDKYYSSSEADDAETLLLQTDLVIPQGIAIAKVNDYVNIREKPGTDSNIVGFLTKNAACIVSEVSADGWAKITSGSISGYILSDYLYMGDAGIQKAKEVAKLTATVNAGSVNVRSTPSSENSDNIITEVSRNEEFDVVDVSSKELLTKNDPNADAWVKIAIDNTEAYVTREFVTVGYTWKQASKPSVVTKSTLRNSIVSEAKKHLGLRYVWGGESLTNGADCSGFVRAVYKKSGVNISGLDRTSYGMAGQSLGRTVTLSNAQPGDLVFYADSKGHVDHVAMYIGNGQVIHESGYTYGCRISNVNYRKVYKIKNFLD